MAGSLALVLAGSNVPTPLYTLYQDRFGFSTGVLTVVFTVYVIGVLSCLIFVGGLSDTVGRRRVLIPALGVAAAGAVVFAAAQGTSWLIVGRVLQGLGAGSLTGAALAAMAELEPAGNHARAARVGAAATVAGLGAGPLVAGVLAAYAPRPLLLVFVLLIPALLLATIAVWAIPETVAEAATGRLSLRPQRLFVPPAIRSLFALAAAGAGAAFAVVGLFGALGPSITQTMFGVDNQAVGGAVVFLLLGTSGATQLGFRAWPLRRALLTGPLLLVAGLALIIGSLRLTSVSLFVIGTLAAGAGHGLTFLGAQQLIDQIASPAHRAEIVSALYVSIYLCSTVPVLGVGFGADAVGFLPAVTTFAVLIAALHLGVAAATSRAALPTTRCDTDALPVSRCQ